MKKHAIFGLALLALQFNPLAAATDEISAVQPSITSAPSYTPSLWNTGDLDALPQFQQKHWRVLEQIRVWHFGSRSVAGMGQMLHEHSDQDIAKALRLDLEQIKEFRQDFGALAGNTQFSTTCYDYMVDSYQEHPPGLKTEPGEYGGYGPITGKTYKNPVRNFIDRITADGLIDAGQTPVSKQGYYLGAMYIQQAEGHNGAANDYHFIRQDEDGLWSDKMGLQPVDRLDSAGNLITDPQTADFGNYKFITYLYVPEGGLDKSKMKHDRVKLLQDTADNVQDIIYTEAGEPVQLPICYDNEGVHVRFQIISRQNPMEPNFWMATSEFTPTSGPIIKFKETITKLPQETIRFAVVHECAHHRLGHVREIFAGYVSNGYIPFSAAKAHSYELSADCEAVMDLKRKFAYGQRDIEKIFAPFPANENSQTHPPTAIRVIEATKCLLSPAS